jgi:ATP-dependent RNA helicase RhlB
MIMDEADRMFELGFIKDIRFLLRHMPGPSERQNLLFSATLSNRVLELAYEHMNDPEKMVVETEKITASSVRQCVYFPATEEKLPLLLGILSRTEADRSMVFVNTKWACERVALTLERAGYKVGVLSGDVPQKKRESLLRRFISGELSLLVATDVAARGLHIPNVSHVYNFDLPFEAEDYVHRIGRTARLGAEGDAISLACDEYAMSLPDIEKFIDQKIPVESITEDLLLPLPPRRRRLNEAGEKQESVIEDAMADAAEERRKRRERDGGSRDGRGGGGGRGRRERAPPSRERPREQTRPAQSSPPPAATGPVTAADSGEQPKRRRRGRGKGKGLSDEASAKTVTPVSADAQVPTAGKPSSKLAIRIKQTFRSLAKRMGMSGRRG